jgi:hypothetical protein
MPDHPVNISPTVVFAARRFGVDLEAIASEAISEFMLREPVKELTSRMQRVLLAAREEAQRHGRARIGTEHVFLCILMDQASIPSRLLADMGMLDSVIERLQTIPSGDGNYTQDDKTE